MNAKRGPKPKYHWDEWFASGRFVLLRKKHYSCSESSIVQQVRNAASARGLKVRARSERNGVVIEVEVRDAESRRKNK